MRCKYCNYDTHEEVIKATFWMDNGLIVIEGIPAWLCKGCEEQFFDEQITRRIQELLNNPTTKPERLIRVSVYDLPQLESTGKHRQFQSIRANKDSQACLQCKYCESETVEELVKSAFWVDEQLIAVENIPARVCQECKEHFYDDEIAETIATPGQLRDVPDGARRDVTASVFSLGDKENAVKDR
jgi:YgiT-type zinc finger domain-containing protein